MSPTETQFGCGSRKAPVMAYYYYITLIYNHKGLIPNSLKNILKIKIIMWLIYNRFKNKEDYIYVLTFVYFIHLILSVTK